MIKYFINTVLQITSAGDKELLYDCRVVDEYYKEVFRETLNEFDKETFEKITNSDKEALLYKNHEKLGKLALLKIYDQQNSSILNGTKWP